MQHPLSTRRQARYDDQLAALRAQLDQLGRRLLDLRAVRGWGWGGAS